MQKFILPAVLTAALGFVGLPSNAQASWFSEALHQDRRDDDRRGDDARYVPAYPAPGSNPGYYTQPVYPGYYTVPGYYPNGYDTPYRDARSHDEWRGRDDRGDRHDERDNRGHNEQDHRR